jgi:hypothetical protein
VGGADAEVVRNPRIGVARLSALIPCGKYCIPVIVCCIDLTHMGVYKEVHDLGDKKPNNLVHKKV